MSARLEEVNDVRYEIVEDRRHHHELVRLLFNLQGEKIKSRMRQQWIAEISGDEEEGEERLKGEEMAGRKKRWMRRGGKEEERERHDEVEGKGKKEGERVGEEQDKHNNLEEYVYYAQAGIWTYVP